MYEGNFDEGKLSKGYGRIFNHTNAQVGFYDEGYLAGKGI